MGDLAILLFEAFIYPGLLFTLVAALVTQWYVRKLYARMQNRVGPLYTGPSGFLQPFADFIKLMCKEDVAVRGSSDKLAAGVLVIAIGALVSLLLMTPLTHPVRALFNSFAVIKAEFDVMLALYLLVWPTVALALIGFMSPNPFSILGGSRLFSIAIAYEVSFALSLLTPVVMASALRSPAFSVYASSLSSWVLWTSPPTAFVMAASLSTALISLQCKLLEKPFDIPEAETEVVAGPFTEYSGPKLALITLLHDVELLAGSTLIAFVFLGGPQPFTYSWWSGLLTFLAKYLAVVATLTLIKAAVARFRVDQALLFFWRYVLPLSLASLVSAVALLHLGFP
ncbi:MAG: NADH-quinone oxidoreductase subunit H [Candidatus Nezhaarchaeota archaeon]|nr:NADH-quinone oxidoreductase subunit H [Candidatus Nezhaarchaeota archaeon]